MSSDTRIINLTRNCRIKRHQAESRIKSGVMGWVEPGVSVRELTFAEVVIIRAEIEAREEYARTAPSKRHDYLPILEPDGHTWQPPQRERYSQRARWELIAAARKHCENPCSHRPA